MQGFHTQELVQFSVHPTPPISSKNPRPPPLHGCTSRPPRPRLDRRRAATAPPSSIPPRPSAGSSRPRRSPPGRGRSKDSFRAPLVTNPIPLLGRLVVCLVPLSKLSALVLSPRSQSIPNSSFFHSKRVLPPPLRWPTWIPSLRARRAADSVSLLSDPCSEWIRFSSSRSSQRQIVLSAPIRALRALLDKSQCPVLCAEFWPSAVTRFPPARFRVGFLRCCARARIGSLADRCLFW